jgi:hypothetical protein
LAKDAKDVPEAAKQARFPKAVSGEADINKIGPYDDPKKDGTFQYVFWVVFEGKNLADCEFRRYVRYTYIVTGKDTIYRPEGSKGFGSPGMTSDKDEPDGPRPAGIQPRDPMTWVAIGDAPGFPPKAGDLGKDEFPVYFYAQFYLFGRSSTDKKIKGQIWYNVVVKAKAIGEVDQNAGPVELKKTPK